MNNSPCRAFDSSSQGELAAAGCAPSSRKKDEEKCCQTSGLVDNAS
jgi:hypothetical protein